MIIALQHPIPMTAARPCADDSSFFAYIFRLTDWKGESGHGKCSYILFRINILLGLITNSSLDKILSGSGNRGPVVEAPSRASEGMQTLIFRRSCEVYFVLWLQHCCSAAASNPLKTARFQSQDWQHFRREDNYA